MQPASSAELDTWLARAFGVVLATAACLPAADATPEAFLRAAEEIGQEIGERKPSAPRSIDHSWAALPARSLPAPSADERRAAIERMLAWAEAGGARWNGIEFHVDADGHASVLASRMLTAGEPILTLPRRLMIVDNELALGFQPARPRDALAAWLPLEGREPTSRWRAYLDALPVQLPELPMFHDEADLAALAGTTARAAAAEDNRDVLDTYGQLAPELRTRLTLADFAWGCAIVQSRAYHAPGSLQHRVALLPLVDLFDHGHGDTTWSYDPLDGTYVVSTERAFSIGEDVHFAYGDRSNTRLFVHFGFTLPNNTADEAGLLFEPASDPVNAIAAHLLWRVPLDVPARIHVTSNFDHRFLRALSLARLQASGPAERARALDAGLGAYGDIPWLGATIEEAALAAMGRAARRSLAELDAHTPREADRAWDRSCSIVRGSERAVLEQIIELANTAPAQLHDPARAADAIPADATGARRLLRQYLHALT